MVCELCGSNEFTKDNDGFFVCDYCRTKYTTEQAKSMLVEGTVVIDRGSEASNLILLAQSAIDINDTFAALEYTNKALEIDAENSNAWFIKGLAASMQLDNVQQDWLASIGPFASTKFVSMANLEDQPWAQVVGSFRKSIEYAAQSDLLSIQSKAAFALNRMAKTIADLSFDSFNKTGWMEANYLAHTDRCLGIIQAHLQSFEWEKNPEPMEEIISVATKLILGIKYKTDSFWSKTVKLSKADQSHFESFIRDANEVLDLLGKE